MVNLFDNMPVWGDWVIIIAILVLTGVIVFYYYRPREIELMEAIVTKEKKKDKEGKEYEEEKIYFKPITATEGDKEVPTKDYKTFMVQQVFVAILGLNIDLIYVIYRFSMPFELLLDVTTAAKGVWLIASPVVPIPLIVIAFVVVYYVKRKRGMPIIAIYLPEERDYSKEDLEQLTRDALKKLREGKTPEVYITYLLYSADENCYYEVDSSPIKMINKETTKWYFTTEVEKYLKSNLYYDSEDCSEKALLVPLDQIKRVHIKKTRKRAEVYAKPFKFSGYVILKELLDEYDILKRRNIHTLAKEHQTTVAELLDTRGQLEQERANKTLLVSQESSKFMKTFFLKIEILKGFISDVELISKIRADKAIDFKVKTDAESKKDVIRSEGE